MRPVQHELDADEGEDQRQAGREIDEPVQQPGDEEVERAQAEQREGVGGEDDEGLVGDAEDGGDRVQREQQVGGADRDQHDQQRRDEPPALVADRQRAAVVVVGDREALAGEPHQRVVLDLRLLVAMAEELHRREQQDQPEDQEHEREQLEQRGAEQDEDHPQDQRQHDPDDQDLLLVLVGHRERAHDDHEHEQVVDRQALLDDVAGEVLAAGLPPRDRPEDDAEADRDGDVEDRPQRRLAEARHGAGAAPPASDRSPAARQPGQRSRPSPRRSLQACAG